MLKSIFISALLVAGINLNLLPWEKVNAQNTPNPTEAETYQPGFWQPIAEVDLNRPITVKLINETGLVVDYALTDVKMKPISIGVDSRAILENVKPEIYIVIYPDTTNPASSTIDLHYSVEVTKENIVNVTIKKIDDGTQSHRSFNLQETGRIYLY